MILVYIYIYIYIDILVDGEGPPRILPSCAMSASPPLPYDDCRCGGCHEALNAPRLTMCGSRDLLDNKNRKHRVWEYYRALNNYIQIYEIYTVYVERVESRKLRVDRREYRV